jgi:hypothetical protein
MKRLIDDPGAPSSLNPLSELVRHAEPFRPNPFRKRLVLARVHTARSAGFRFRLGAALAVALIGTATASAAVGYRWFAVDTPVQKAPESPAVLPAVPPPVKTESVVPSLPGPRPAPSVVPRQPESAPAKAVETGASARAGTKHGAAALDKALPPGEDPAPVLDAIRALRKSGDPERAQKLLDQYLASNPRGALSEDALGLAMEAAAARRDPRAAEYARRYLARFPKGRFSAQAHKALARR